MPYHFHALIQGDPGLPVVLFLHGFLGSSRDFEPVMAQLSDQFCCIALDLPGHGQTAVEGGDDLYRMPDTANALVDWLDEHRIPTCLLVGYSMGGRLALYLAIHFAHRFPKVILESASPGLKTEPERQARLQYDRALADQLAADFPAFLTGWYGQPLFQSLQQHAAFGAMLERRWQNRPDELAKSLRSLGTGNQPSLWERLKSHRQPLLLLVGEGDRKFCRINQEMATHCPTAQLEIIPGCGHVVHLECPTGFTRHIRDFYGTFPPEQHSKEALPPVLLGKELC